MQRLPLIVFIAFELCYYLLIVQTGIAEHFGSNIYTIAPLPIGGIIGSAMAYYIKATNSNKIRLFLILQLFMSFFYPNFNFLELFILGISVGAMAPLIINELKKASKVDMGFALAISYVLGTYLFTFEVESRIYLALSFTIIVFISSLFIDKIIEIKYETQSFSLFVMSLWIFLDSALFETLSRDTTISIWRDGYSFEIALFHIIGLIAALYFKIEKNQKELLVVILFAFSYLLYFLQEAFILSLVYPFVISFYNIVILQTLLKKDLKTLSIYMVFIGWLASGAGLFTALENLTLFVPLIFLISLIKILTSQQNLNEVKKIKSKEEQQYVQNI